MAKIINLCATLRFISYCNVITFFASRFQQIQNGWLFLFYSCHTAITSLGPTGSERSSSSSLLVLRTEVGVMLEAVWVGAMTELEVCSVEEEVSVCCSSLPASGGAGGVQSRELLDITLPWRTWTSKSRYNQIIVELGTVSWCDLIIH